MNGVRAADEPSADHHGGEEFNAKETILHHILDTHDWHITDIPAGKDEHGHTTYKPIALHLPWLFYSSRDGFVFAANTHALEEKGYTVFHEKVYAVDAASHEGDAHAEAAHENSEGDHAAEAHAEGEEHDHPANADMSVSVIDLSITKTVLQMMLVGLLLVWVFTSIAKAYVRREGQAPKGAQSFFEPIIVFVREDIAKNYLGDKADKFLPYLLTLFFFIWFANLLGLTPFNSNIAGNISVTAALAVLTFILIQFNGTKDYWQHIFNTPGVPWWLKFGIPLMPIVELIGLFTKPFALAVRLFANITAGHFMVLGLICLIFIMGNNGTNFTGGMGIMPISVLFTTVIFALEMIVAIIQPYIFTLLTAVFIGMAMESHDDHH
ncbi:MAG: F0F1 ATP synthase subunit A [Bacteroidota bacterium]